VSRGGTTGTLTVTRFPSASPWATSAWPPPSPAHKTITLGDVNTQVVLFLSGGNPTYRGMATTRFN
jgi:hypothetical protein